MVLELVFSHKSSKLPSFFYDYFLHASNKLDNSCKTHAISQIIRDTGIIEKEIPVFGSIYSLHNHTQLYFSSCQKIEDQIVTTAPNPMNKRFPMREFIIGYQIKSMIIMGVWLLTQQMRENMGEIELGDAMWHWKTPPVKRDVNLASMLETTTEMGTPFMDMISVTEISTNLSIENASCMAIKVSAIRQFVYNNPNNVNMSYGFG
ncbi:hypothetical protein LXL04_024680 [Taraxacum kok-saghyz]